MMRRYHRFAAVAGPTPADPCASRTNAAAWLINPVTTIQIRNRPNRIDSQRTQSNGEPVLLEMTRLRLVPAIGLSDPRSVSNA